MIGKLMTTEWTDEQAAELANNFTSAITGGRSIDELEAVRAYEDRRAAMTQAEREEEAARQQGITALINS